MSASNKKGSSSLRQTFESIKDLLLTTKVQLEDLEQSSQAVLVKNLHKVASLAESYTEQRPKSNQTDASFSDILDQEGVNLWNISGLVRNNPSDGVRALVAALRLAAFRLVEAGLEPKPGIESLLHILQLASKTGATLSEDGSHDIGAAVLTSAAKYEEQLRSARDPDGTHTQAIACTTVIYFSSRMEAAWREGNITVAEYALQQITGDEQRLTLLPTQTQELLAFKLYTIGKSLLKEQGHDRVRPDNAVTWLQKAFSIVDHLEDTDGSGVETLKISILRTLARAYFLSEIFDRAEATLDELIPSLNSSTAPDNSEHQELRWLRLAILKRRKANEATLLDAFKNIIDYMDYTETNITDLLQELRTLAHQHTLVLTVHQYCLHRALRLGDSGSKFVDRLLLAIIFHCGKDQDHGRAIQAMNAAFTSISDSEFELPVIPTTACLTLIWQYGDGHHQAKRWTEAADWFLAGSHKLFQVNCPTANSKCLRKAALCYIEQREYAKASTVIRRCPTSEATTHYVTFLTAFHQAIRAIQKMVDAPDFDRKMLLLATQITHQSEMRHILLSVLEALFQTLKFENATGEPIEEAMALIRCIIRLSLKLLEEPGANKSRLISGVIKHFQIAKHLAEEANKQKAFSLIIKDVSWLWRTAYNTAVLSCTEWEGSPEQTPEMFDIARELLETCRQASPVDVDAELYTHLINASFSAVCGRVFATRKAQVSGSTIDATRLRGIAAEVRSCKHRLTELAGSPQLASPADAERVQYFTHTLRIFEAEIFAQLKSWDQLSEVIEDVVSSGPLAVMTYEAIADVLWAEKECPVNVLYKGLEAILRASIDHKSLSLEKFARWLRALCTIILARNTPADRAKAIGYVEQAVIVMEEHNDSDEVCMPIP
ncbi:hypothetical protein AX16_010805 [Volvariella volvacea WC 439]|nr:hypothetical protein AX16_010805 [Volvariella volvacea WC 439]